MAEILVLSSRFQSPSVILSTSPELIIVQPDHLPCGCVMFSLGLFSAQWDFLFPTEQLFKAGINFPCAALCWFVLLIFILILCHPVLSQLCFVLPVPSLIV